jgi:hypothetical protein
MHSGTLRRVKNANQMPSASAKARSSGRSLASHNARSGRLFGVDDVNSDPNGQDTQSAAIFVGGRPRMPRVDAERSAGLNRGNKGQRQSFLVVNNKGLDLVHF